MNGKVVVITGGNRGIGKATVEKFAADKATVVFNSSKYDEKAEKFAEEMKNAYSTEVLYIPCDVRIESEIDNMIKTTIEKFSRIDILVNNSGKAFMGKLIDTSLEDYEECIKINLTGPFLFMKKVVPLMQKNKWGRIINITSGTTVRIQPALSVYMAAKSGLNLLTKGLALEIAIDNITVNNVLPGATDTDMVQEGISGISMSLNVPKEVFLEKIISDHAIKRLVSPKEIAEMVYFLSRDEAGSITGGNFHCDCGFAI